mgnify:CR=1 FL=1
MSGQTQWIVDRTIAETGTSMKQTIAEKKKEKKKNYSCRKEEEREREK